MMFILLVSFKVLAVPTANLFQTSAASPLTWEKFKPQFEASASGSQKAAKACKLQSDQREALKISKAPTKFELEQILALAKDLKETPDETANAFSQVVDLSANIDAAQAAWVAERIFKLTQCTGNVANFFATTVPVIVKNASLKMKSDYARAALAYLHREMSKDNFLLDYALDLNILDYLASARLIDPNYISQIKRDKEESKAFAQSIEAEAGPAARNKAHVIFINAVRKELVGARKMRDHLESEILGPAQAALR